MNTLTKQLIDTMPQSFRPGMIKMANITPTRKVQPGSVSEYIQNTASKAKTRTNLKKRPMVDQKSNSIFSGGSATRDMGEVNSFMSDH